MGMPIKVANLSMQHSGNVYVQYAVLQENSYPAHTHDFDELVIIVGGSGEHFINNDSYPIQAGDIFVLKGEDAHGFKNIQNLALFNISYRRSFIMDLNSDIRMLAGFHALFLLEPLYRKSDTFKSRLHLSYQQMLGIQTILSQLKEETERCDDGSNTMIESLFLQLSVTLSRLYTSSHTHIKRTALQIADAVSYMERNYAEKINLQQLADMTHLSISHFSKIFRQVYHLSPMDYLQQIRLEKARHLLCESEFRVSEIAIACGFDNSNYFSRVFKMKHGLSPTKWCVHNNISNLQKQYE